MKRFLTWALLISLASFAQAGVKAVKTTKSALSNQYVDIYTAYVTPSQTNSVVDTIMIYGPGEGSGSAFNISAIGDTVVSVQIIANATSSDSIRCNFSLLMSYKVSPTLTSTRALHPDWTRLYTGVNNRAVSTADDSSSFINNLSLKRPNAAVSGASAVPVQMCIRYNEENALNSVRPFNIYIAIPKKAYPTPRIN